MVLAGEGRKRAGTGTHLSLAHARDLWSRAGAGVHILARGAGHLAGEGGTPPRRGQLHAPLLNSSLPEARRRHAPSHPAWKKRAAGDGRARRALPGYGPPGGAGARRGQLGAVGRVPPRPRGPPLPLPPPAPAHGRRPREPGLRARRRGPARRQGGGGTRRPPPAARPAPPLPPRPAALSALPEPALWPATGRLSLAPAWDDGHARAPAAAAGDVCGDPAHARGERSGAGWGQERLGAAESVREAGGGALVEAGGAPQHLVTPVSVPQRLADL